MPPSCFGPTGPSPDASLRSTGFQRGRFPCFDATIKALRRPAAHPAALRFLRLAVPHRSLAVSLPRVASDKHLRTGASFLAELPTSARSLRKRQDLPRSCRTPIVPLPCSPTPVGPNTPGPLRRVDMAPAVSTTKAPHVGTFEAQSHGFGTRCLRFAVAGYPTATQDSLPAAGQALPDGLDHPQGSIEGFQICLLHLILPSHAFVAQGHNT